MTVGVVPFLLLEMSVSSSVWPIVQTCSLQSDPIIKKNKLKDELKRKFVIHL